MANTFKSDTKSSLVTATITDPSATVITTPSNASVIVLGLLASNKLGTSSNVDIYLDKSSGDDTYIVKNGPVPAGSTLEIINGNKIVLEASDKIQARSDTANAIDLTISYLEQT